MTETRKPPRCHYDRALRERVIAEHRDDCPHELGTGDCPATGRGCAPCTAPHLKRDVRPLTCDNGRSKAEPRVNGTRPLTRSLDLTEEGLAMKATPKTCDAPGCDRPARSRNYAWCTLHDRRVRLYGTVDLPPGHERHQNQGHACAADGCDVPAKAKGYCGLHSERVRRHGSPDVEMPAVARQVVYFVLAPQSRKIKIGLTATPTRRLAALQTGSPEPLELLGVVAGGRRLETRLHRELVADRSHGEWFHCTDRVLARVNDMLGTPTGGRP